MFKICCNLEGLAEIFSRVKFFVAKDILRIKVENVFHESFTQLSRKLPPISAEDLKIIEGILGEFFHKNADISEEERRVFMLILPVSLIAVWPKISRESLMMFFQIVLEEIRDLGKLLIKN